jgi:oligopeptide transport system substrate-binding protein
VGIEVLNATHLRFTLERPASYFPAILTLPTARPLPRRAIEEHGEDWTEPENIITNGPYRLVDWVHDNHITLEKNETYYAAQNVQIERVVMWMVDEETTWEQYQAGFLDTAGIPLDLLEQVRSDPLFECEVHSGLRGQGGLYAFTYYYGFNVDIPPFDNLLVRKAFIVAVDRLGVMEVMEANSDYVSLSEMPLTLTSPGIFGYVNGKEARVGISYDSEQAKKWLAEAGYPNGNGLSPITIWYNDSWPYHEAVAEYIRQNWIDHLGVTVELHSMPWREYLDQLDSGQCQVWRSG